MFSSRPFLGIFLGGMFCAGVLMLAFSLAPRGAIAASAPPSSACQNYVPQARGYYFDEYEQAEYVDGLLRIHFRLRVPAGGMPFVLGAWFPDDACEPTSFGNPARGGEVYFSPELTRWSIRFVSPTRFEVWNDGTGTPEPCQNCVFDVPAAEPYFYFALSGMLGRGVSSFVSGAYHILENAAPPPVREDTLPTPPGCPPFEAVGSLFDDYERAEYGADGTLRLHLRYISRFSDGRGWTPRARFFDDDCALVEDVVFTPLFERVYPRPGIRYWSIRFPTPTTYEIWDDERGVREECPYCAGDLSRLIGDRPFRYVGFGGSIDFGAWQFRTTPFPPADARMREPVIVVPGLLGSAEKNGVWVIDPIFHVYDDLIETLAANGYERGVNLFTFAYDWRASNRLTALLLRERINEVQELCGCPKVDIVAHSMGGLAARQYIQSDKYEGDVDQLIFLGTPHLGAPKAYLLWEGGESPDDFSDRFLKFLLSREAKKSGFESLFAYVRGRPMASIEELLPITDYLEDDATGAMRRYPDAYPRNEFLEKLNENIGALLHAGVRVSNFVGDIGTSTIIGLRVTESDSLPLWEHGYPVGGGLVFGIGDGTVSLESGGFIKSSIEMVSAKHRFLPSFAQGTVFKTLTGGKPETLIRRNLIPNIRLLSIKILSPADIVVITPDGKRVGKDFATGGEVNEIDGAFYSGFLTDDEYVTIPNPLDGEYTVQTMGTGEGGEYTLAAGYLSDEATAEAEFKAVTAPGLVTPLLLTVNGEEPQELSVRPLDETPPLIAVGSPATRDYPRSELSSVDVTITDDESGVLSSLITLDGREAQNGEILDFFFGTLGPHRLVVSAKDRVGNAATTTLDFRVMATPASTIADIERAYSLGWIKNNGMRTSLIKKLEGKKSERSLRAFRNELAAQRGKHIHEQAYQVLVEDVGWLLAN